MLFIFFGGLNGNILLFGYGKLFEYGLLGYGAIFGYWFIWYGFIGLILFRFIGYRLFWYGLFEKVGFWLFGLESLHFW